MSTRNTAKLAAVQAAPVWLNRDATIEKACRLIHDAGKAGADIIGFPENFIPGHPVWYYFYPATSEKSMSLATKLFQNSVEIPSPATDMLCRAAAQADIHVVIGLTERVSGTTGSLYNTQLFINASGQIVGKHQKLVPTIGERLVHMGGAPRDPDHLSLALWADQRTFLRREFQSLRGQHGSRGLHNGSCGELAEPFHTRVLRHAGIESAGEPEHRVHVQVFRDQLMWHEFGGHDQGSCLLR